jgi:predicted Zn-dependent protease
MCLKRIGSCLLFCAINAIGQDTPAPDDLGDRAVREFRKDDWPAAERDFREVVKRDSSNILAQIYLGQSLFRQEHYAEAAIVFQKARDLEKSGKELSIVQDRILTDQLVMSYGITGELKKTHSLLNEATGKDPGYPLNYYNLACAYAEEGDKAKALANLQLAFDRKGNILKGEQMPDPRADSSFQKYVRDSDFVSLMKKLGLN